MEKNKVKILVLGLLLSLPALNNPCTTSYGLGGEVELCIENNDPETPFFLYDQNENDTWIELFHEGELEDYEE
jgi:hypothetical protein